MYRGTSCSGNAAHIRAGNKLAEYHHQKREMGHQCECYTLVKGKHNTSLCLYEIICDFLIVTDCHALHANCRHWYKVFCTTGCKLDNVRYTGEDNSNLLADESAKRFDRFLKECCNLHHGRDYTYLKETFFRKHKLPKKRTRPTVSACMHLVV